MGKFKINPFTNNPDIAEQSYNVNGQYSNRFSEVATATSMVAALNEIYQFTSVDCSTSLSLNPSATREKGNTLASITLTATNTTGQNPTGTLTTLVFKRGAATLDTVNSPGGSEQYVESVAVTDTTTFSCELTDSEARTATSSKTITFLYPILHLVGAASLSTANIYSGGTKILSSTKGRTLEFSPSNQVVYYCIPQTLGTLSSILDENGFETFGDWTRRDENITGLDTNPVAYYIYEFNNLTTQTDFGYTFS